MSTTKYTLVQHSAFLVNREPGFEHALEVRVIDARTAAKVERAGGLVFDTYRAADEAEYELGYAATNGIYPRVRGTFGRTKAQKIDDGRPLYLPTDEDRELLGLTVPDEAEGVTLNAFLDQATRGM